jgi:putative transposase
LGKKGKRAMPKQSQAVELHPEEVAYLKRYVNQGKRSARAIKRAHLLLHRHAGKSPQESAELSGVSLATIYNVCHRYHAEGVEAALEERPRSGQPRKLQLHHEAKLTVLACSEPPDGQARWSVRLLHDKAIELGLVEDVGRDTIRLFLKKMHSSRG